MKNVLQNFLYLLLLLVLSTSCSMFEKDFDVTNNVPVAFTATSGQQINATIKEVDFNSGDIKENKDRIKDLNIEGITYRVSQFMPTANNNVNPVINGQLEYAPVGSTTFKKASTLTNLDLKALNTTPPAQDPSIPIDAANKSDLVNLIKGGQKVQFRISGTTSSPFASAVIDFKIKSKLTAGL